MNYWMAFAIGALSGSRSMLTPALVANLRPRAVDAAAEDIGLPSVPAAGRATAALAVGEMLADKSSWIPARTDALSLTGRMASGAAAAAICGDRDDRARCAAFGALGALAATFALYHLRTTATERWGVPNKAAGLIEDAAALTGGLLLLR